MKNKKIGPPLDPPMLVAFYFFSNEQGRHYRIFCHVKGGPKSREV